MTKLYPRPNEQKSRKGAVPVTNIDFSSQKSSLPTGSIEKPSMVPASTYTSVGAQGGSRISGRGVQFHKEGFRFQHFT